MNEIAPPPAPTSHFWKTCLDIEGQEAGHYLDYVNTRLFDIVAGSPRRVLELGCSTGAFGREYKVRHPGATVVGVDAGRAAAKVAADRLDRVIVSRLEDLDFEAQGFKPGEFDCVIAADILEHVPNPWAFLVKLRPYLSADAQVIASIPNVRNALLIAALAVQGRWQYRERGLLDITHLRFFTLAEMQVMFEETGYRAEGYTANISIPLIDFYNQNKDRERTTVQLGRLTLADVTKSELMELCAEQFLIRARLA